MLKLIRFTVLVFGAVTVQLPAQVMRIEPALFAQHYEDSAYLGLVYRGHGQFCDYLTCPTDWFDVTFSEIEFDCSSRMLTVEGEVSKPGWGWTFVTGSQMTVGIPITGDNRRGGPMDVRLVVANDSLGGFRHTVGPIQTGDRIVFTISEQATENRCSWSKVYNVGQLADWPIDRGDGATLGQR